jgi:hypothetical protein
MMALPCLADIEQMRRGYARDGHIIVLRQCQTSLRLSQPLQMLGCPHFQFLKEDLNLQEQFSIEGLDDTDDHGAC